jgi:rhamnosyltransferase
MPYSLPFAAMRRSAWQKRQFYERAWGSEDAEWGHAAKRAGKTIRYVSEARVMHSHNYTPRQAYKRSFGEAWALADVWRGTAHDFNVPRTVLLGWLRDAWSDLRYCQHTARLNEWSRTLAIRWQQRLGRLHGFHAGWQMHRVDRAL